MGVYKTFQGWSSMQIRFAALILACLFAGLFALTTDTPSQAATTLPTKMNFQGRIANSSGTILANGTYNMRFKIWNAASGGAQQWSEDRLVSAAQGVVVTNGQFSVQLGSVTPLNASVFASSSLYFEVELPTPGSATSTSPVWTEGAMTPRNQLATSAYAYNAETLDGIDGAAFAQMGQANTFTGNNTFSGTSGFSNTVDVNAANTAAFQVRNGATNLFSVNSTGSQITIGTADTTGAVLVLDTKTNAGDPTGTNGAMYYNSSTNKFRCFQNGAWTDCVAAGGSTTLQNAYDNSGTPATITTTAAKGFRIAAGAAPTASLFTVTNAGQAVATNNVNGIDVNYNGGTTASIEGAGIRVDYTPGTGSGSTWNGMRIVSGDSAAGTTTNGLKIEGPTNGNGTDTGVSVGGGFDIGVDIASGGIQMTDVPVEPNAPAASNLKVYAQDIAGRMMLKIKGPSGLDTALQPALFNNSISMLLPSTGTGVTTWGLQNSAVGTISTPTIANTNLAASMRKIRVTSATTANAASELRSTQPLVWRGTSAGLGGFFYAARISVNSTTTNQRLFSGLTSSTGATATTQDPAALTNMVGVGWGSGEANLRVMTNDGTGAATEVDLGANFPANNTAAVYEVIFFAPPNGSTIGYRIIRLDTNQSATGTLSTDLPTNSLMLTHHQYMNNGGTAASVVLDVTRVYVESDY